MELIFGILVLLSLPLLILTVFKFNDEFIKHFTGLTKKEEQSVFGKVVDTKLILSHPKHGFFFFDEDKQEFASKSFKFRLADIKSLNYSRNEWFFKLNSGSLTLNFQKPENKTSAYMAKTFIDKYKLKTYEVSLPLKVISFLIIILFVILLLISNGEFTENSYVISNLY